MSSQRPRPAAADALGAALRSFKWVALTLLALFLASGVTVVQPGEVALVLRFGRLVGDTPDDQVKPPGLLFALPAPIDRVVRVPVMREGEVEVKDLWKPLADPAGGDTIPPLQEGYCLSGDQNLVQLRLVAKYKIADPVAYALRSDRPEGLVRDAVMAAATRALAGWRVDDALRLRAEEFRLSDRAVAHLRAAGLGAAAERVRPLIGVPVRDRTGFEAALSEPGRLTPAEWAAHGAAVVDLADRVEENLGAAIRRRAEDRLTDTGLTLSALEVKEVHPPRHVVGEFQQAQSARVETETRRREAEGYAAREVPRARAERDRLVKEAEADRSTVAAQAAAEATVFGQVLGEYRHHPRLVRERLFREAVETALSQVGRRVPVRPGDRVLLADPEEHK